MKIKRSQLEALVSEVIDEIIEELTTTGDIAGFDAPMGKIQRKKINAFDDEEDKQ